MRLGKEPNKSARQVLLALLIAAAAGCAAFQPPDANGPRSNTPPYPIIADESARAQGATLAWQQLADKYGLPNSSADLQPITGTLRSIAAAQGAAVFLPKVGDRPTETEEEIRESLRRFIVEWKVLLGTEPNQLSLTEQTDVNPAVKIARYEQRPFRYPMRGEFGKLSIRFQNDRRVLDISSTCLPNTERLQAALNALTPKVTADDAAALVKERPITPPTPASPQSTISLPATAVVNVRELVTYVLPTSDKQSLEMRLAWEIDVTNGPIKTIYLDAINAQVIALT